VRHLEPLVPLLDNGLGHRTLDLGKHPPDLFEGRDVLPLDLPSAVGNGLVIDQVVEPGDRVPMLDVVLDDRPDVKRLA
jgi:hypothetical protein